MKAYFDYNGVVPSGVNVIHEGRITRIFFDYATEEREYEAGKKKEKVTLLTAQNVDIEGALDYGKVVSALVRDRYTADEVEAILANHAAGIGEEEYAAFQEWRERAKEIAHSVTD